MPKLEVAQSAVTQVDVIDLQDLPNEVRKVLIDAANTESDDQLFLAVVDQWMNASVSEWMLPDEVEALRNAFINGKKLKLVVSENTVSGLKEGYKLKSSGWNVLATCEDIENGDFYQSLFTK